MSTYVSVSMILGCETRIKTNEEKRCFQCRMMAIESTCHMLISEGLLLKFITLGSKSEYEEKRPYTI